MLTGIEQCQSDVEIIDLGYYTIGFYEPEPRLDGQLAPNVTETNTNRKYVNHCLN